ncbi:hypothetical protein [Bradyrhizobium elkanii]|uniref:hypothetical protein n=1 Tax=Bradyrhizobium elkanii TaxID=29448 RepID=UPI0022261DF6|nr:hypothetical protein [Bradyrhizobium elkanii]MCW2110270.1 hypothetical protein [Bradyrhizobium elkanii]WLB76438.1 hypothetical protein QIH89_22110 [Bradyrhizobium elkanii]
MSSIGEQFGIKGRRKILSKDVPGRRNHDIRMWDLKSKPGTSVERLEKAYVEALAAVDLSESIGRQLQADARFTEQGREDQHRSHILNKGVPIFHHGRRTISRARQELDEMRGRLTLPKADPTDAAGAIARMEIRTWLRSLPQGERDKVTRAENVDPQIRAAIIEAPAVMTGVADSHLSLLKEHVLREVHGSLLDEITELTAAIDIAASAVEAGRDSARIDTGMTAEQFNEAAAPIEAREQVPWLRKGKVVDLERGVMREPTEDELANGVEAPNLEEFNRLKAA